MVVFSPLCESQMADYDTLQALTTALSSPQNILCLQILVVSLSVVILISQALRLSPVLPHSSIGSHWKFWEGNPGPSWQSIYTLDHL